MDAYREIRYVGKGAHGQCHLVMHKRTQRQYILKRIPSRGHTPEIIENESSVLRAVGTGHPNICQYKDSFIHQDDFCIVMPFYQGGDLQGLIDSRRRAGRPLASDTVLDYLLQLCLGLKHIHEKNILHRDIKPSNVFVTRANVLKIGDFGISKILGGAGALAQTGVGTPYYISPEKLRGTPYGPKSDMWSLGCLLYELCALRVPFRGKNMRDLSAKILSSPAPAVPSRYGKFISTCVKALLQKEPSKRPSAARILRTRVMQGRLLYHSTRFQRRIQDATRKKAGKKAGYRFGDDASPRDGGGARSKYGQRARKKAQVLQRRAEKDDKKPNVDARSKGKSPPRKRQAGADRVCRQQVPGAMPSEQGHPSKPIGEPHSQPRVDSKNRAAWAAPRPFEPPAGCAVVASDEGANPDVSSDDATAVVDRMRSQLQPAGPAAGVRLLSPGHYQQHQQEQHQQQQHQQQPNDHKARRRAAEAKIGGRSHAKSAKSDPKSDPTAGATNKYEEMLASKIKLTSAYLERLLGPALLYVVLGFLRHLRRDGAKTQSKTVLQMRVVEKFFLPLGQWTWDMKWECAAELVDLVEVESRLVAAYIC